MLLKWVRTPKCPSVGLFMEPITCSAPMGSCKDLPIFEGKLTAKMATIQKTPKDKRVSWRNKYTCIHLYCSWLILIHFSNVLLYQYFYKHNLNVPLRIWDSWFDRFIHIRMNTIEYHNIYCSLIDLLVFTVAMALSVCQYTEKHCDICKNVS